MPQDNEGSGVEDADESEGGEETGQEEEEEEQEEPMTIQSSQEIPPTQPDPEESPQQEEMTTKAVYEGSNGFLGDGEKKDDKSSIMDDPILKGDQGVSEVFDSQVVESQDEVQDDGAGSSKDRLKDNHGTTVKGWQDLDGNPPPPEVTKQRMEELQATIRKLKRQNTLS